MTAIGDVNGLVIDGADTFELARFWGAVFDTEIDSVENEGQYIDLTPTASGLVLRLQRVPETKEVKNRLHLDIEVADMAAAVARTESLGAAVVRQNATEFGWDCTVMADPEGNEFCLISPAP